MPTPLRPFAIATLAALTLAVAPSAQAGDETRPLATLVDRIELNGPIDAQIDQGETRGIHIAGSDAQRARVRVDVRDRTLVVSWEGKSKTDAHSGDVRISLAVPQLLRLALKGSGDVQLGAFVQPAEPLALEVAGSGDVSAERVQVATLDVAISGSGDIRVGGSAARQSVSIAGSGDYAAPKLASRNAKVAIAGSGDVEIAASELLEVSIAGSGDVRYHGQPKVNRAIAGSGEVRPASER